MEATRVKPIKINTLRRKGHVQIIPYGVGQKTPTLPVKIMVMGDRRNRGFGNYLRNGQAKRNIQRNRNGVLRDQKVNLELADKFVDLLFELIFDLVDFFCD